jgi:hypothetical protein
VATLPDSPHFVGWPAQLPSGDLVYFHGERFLPDVGVPLVMVQSHPDGSNRVQLRPEVFYPSEALWAQARSLALIRRAYDEDGSQVVLARTDGSPLEVLLRAEMIWSLAWGP